VLGDGAATLYQINQVSLRQAVAPERLLGRITASVHFFGLAAMLAGPLAGGLSGEIAGVRMTLFAGGFGTTLSTLWLLLSPIRTLRTVAGDVVETVH